LRKTDPGSIINIIEIFNQKKNNYRAGLKMSGEEGDKNVDKKIQFLEMELQDIKNNKGNVTLQVRSTEHL
jgi:hypothetical protein